MTMKYISILFLSIFVENALFMRALGTRRMLVLINKDNKLFKFGYLLLIISIINTSIIWYVNLFLEKYEFYYMIMPFIFIFCMSISYIIAYIIIKNFWPDFLERNLHLIISSNFNTLIFGSLLLTFSHNYEFIESIVFIIGTQIGFIIATLLVIEGNKRLKISNIPKSFKGLPINLIYIGILSLAFYGLVGHLLPS